MKIFEWKKNGKKKYSKNSIIKTFLLYKKNNGKIFGGEKKNKVQKFYYFFYIVKFFYYGNFWMRKNWEKKVFKIFHSKKILLWKKNNGKIFGFIFSYSNN
jgi:hypothetical protein